MDGRVMPTGPGAAAPACPGRWAARAPGRREWDLLVNLVGRHIRLAYGGSAAGVLWGLLIPLALLAIYNVVFTRVIRFDFPHFTAYLFCGMLPWNWFHTTLRSGLLSLVENRDLVRRPGFPKGLLPLVSVVGGGLVTALGYVVLLGFLLYDGFALSPALLALPFILGLQLLFTWGLALALAVANTWFRDLEHLLTILLMGLFFLTPVFYRTDMVPPGMRWIYVVNPLARVIEATREILLAGRLPGLAETGGTALLCLGTLALGLLVFRRYRGVLPDEV